MRFEASPRWRSCCFTCGWGFFRGFGSAIDLFFVLSGYLITTIVLREWGTHGFLRVFYVRRALRIWPIYYLAIAACYVMNPWLPHPDPLDGSGYFWTYTQFTPGYWSDTMPTFSRLARHTWTLAIEEQFYLFWPVMVGLAGRRWLVGISVPLAVAPVVMRSLGYFPHLLLTRCDGLALGAILAGLLFDQGRVERNRRRFQAGFAGVSGGCDFGGVGDENRAGASGGLVVWAGVAFDLAVSGHSAGGLDLFRDCGAGGVFGGGGGVAAVAEPAAGGTGAGELWVISVSSVCVFGGEPGGVGVGDFGWVVAGWAEDGALRGSGGGFVAVFGEADPLAQGAVSV